MQADEPSTSRRDPDTGRAGERYRALLENAYEIVAEVNTLGQFLWVSPVSEQITGFSPEEVVGKSVFEHVHEDDRAQVIEIFRQAVEEDRPGRAVYRHRHKDGRWLWLESAGRPYRGPDGERLGVIHTRDVTERVEAEHALREEEERYRALAENVDDLIVELDEQGRYVYVSPSFCEDAGWEPESFLGRTPERSVHPEDWPRVEACIARGLLSGRPARVEYRARLGRDEWLWIEAATRPFRTRGDRWHLAAVCRDVTARKKAEEANASLAIALDRATDAVLVADANGTIRFVNASFARLVRRPATHLLGRRADVLAEPPHGIAVAAAVEHARRAVLAGEPWTGTFEDRDREGRPIHYRASVSRAVDAEGRVTHLIGVVHDITREVELEGELRQTQKLEALGTLAGGVAHDFNNLLTGILGYADMLKSGLRQESEVREAAEVIEGAAQRGAELARQLLGFAGRAPQGTAPVDVHAVVRDVSKLLTRTIPRGIHVHQRLEASCSTIAADRGQVQQILLNLALNARDAMPEGGELWFETALETAEATTGEGPGHGSTEPQLVVRVRDTGLGMSKDVQARIFEPFFTTRPQGRGTGMGLAVVYGIVSRCGGTVTVHSEPGRGTEFRLALPLARHETPRSRVVAGIVTRGTGRILVVDDEPAVRRVLGRMLESLGYAVVALGDGREAVEYYRTRGAVLDLVIVDLDMPGMGGEECFRHLREIDPGVRVLVSTGLGPAGAVEALVAAGARGYLGKPYVVAELAEAVSRALADDAGGVESV